jgi:type II secretory pathway pseudopilin PulG
VRKILKMEKGFTVIEIIAIFVIVGIVSAVAISRINSTADYGRIVEFDKVKSHLRYAQSRAIRTNSNWGINFSTSNTYWLFQTVSTNKILFVGEASNSVTLSKLSITSALPTITFDSFGSPGAADVIVTTSGGNITVTANTGFIP